METRIRTPKDILLEKWAVLNEVNREKLLFIAEGMRLAEEKARKETEEKQA